MMDAVLTYHTNVLACGVAKFNEILAGRFAIPLAQILSPEAREFSRPLLSLKLSEFTAADRILLARFLDASAGRRSLRLFLHDYSDLPIEHRLLRQADLVYCGNGELAREIQAIRPDVRELWAPSMLHNRHRFAPAQISVFSFGMAHKVRVDHYRALHRLLEATGQTYCVYLSTALHEGTTLDGSFERAYAELREIFADRLYFLGYLSDAAVYNYLLTATYFCAFFTPAARANNTSLHAAMETGAVVVTNVDADSPAWMRHEQTVIDIARCRVLPTEPAALDRLRRGARDAVRARDWDALVTALRPRRPIVGRVREDVPAGLTLAQETAGP